MAASSSSKAWFTSSGRTTGITVFMMATAAICAVLHEWHESSIVPQAAAISSEAQHPAATTLAVNTPPPVEAKDLHAEKKYQRLGEYVARRYRVSSAVATEIVAKAHVVGRRLDLDPMLILAVISVESRFNPIAESNMGAKGLMQVIPRLHADKFLAVGGPNAVFELEPNITVGARILKDYLRYTGDLLDALQMYVGASTQEDASEYSEKVTRERERLNQIARRRSDAGTAL
jgi:soluble lytic murein transglycosylase-like protein